MNLVDQLRSQFQRRRKDPTQLLDLSDSAGESSGRHRDQYLTSEHFHDLADENHDAGDDNDSYE